MAQVNDLLVLGKANFLNEISSSQLLRAFGGIALNESTEQSTSLEYVLGIKAFASGGNVLWSSVSNFANVIRLNASGNWGINISGTAAKATADASGNTITSTYAKVKTWNDMIHSSNEYTFASPAYSGAIWINYRTASGATDGNITTYNFGNGKAGTSGVTLVATTFNGNATSANYATSAGNATTASALTNITTTDKASSSATQRRIWFCYDNNITGRPAYDDRFTIQTSTGTLTAPIFSGTLSGNASSATKLATARTIFGRSFNGTANVEGQALVYGSYNATAGSRYSTGGIQIRENGLVGNAQSDLAYAPAIGFHWANRIAASLLFHSDGIFYFRKQNFTDRATIDANVNGNATSATTATTASRLSLGGVASSTTYGTYAGIIQDNSTGPESGSWHNTFRILHNNSQGYYTDVAVNFTGSHGLWFRSNRAGSVSSWYKAATQNAENTFTSTNYFELAYGHHVAAHYRTTSSNTGYYKININSENAWMTTFTIRVYQSYKWSDIVISGYNYGSNHWYSPVATMMGSSDANAMTVYFGYDGNYKLWVAIPAANYTGIDIIDVANGYNAFDSYKNLFTITHMTTLSGTTQSTQTVYRPWYRNERVSESTTCEYPAGFTSRSTNATWGNQTGSTVTCWNEANGGSVDWRRDNPSSGKISLKLDGRFYGNEGANPAMLMATDGSYWGMGTPDGDATSWIRTTSQGIIPYQSGGRGSGHQYLGTSSWYFSQAYIDNVNSNTTYAYNWFRSYNNTGWFNETYGGGIYMEDTTWVRVYNNKSFYCAQTIGAGGRIYTGYDSGEANSVSCSNWFRSNGDTGWYNASYGCHVRPNTLSSYGSIRIHGNARNGYEGIHFGASTNGLTIMSQDGSHQGLYNQAAGKWIIYYPGSGSNLGVGTSSLTSGYNVTQGSTSITGGLYMNNTSITGVNDFSFADPGVQEGITWAGGNGWWIYESPDGLTNAAGNLQFVQSSTRRMTIRTDGAIDVPSRLFVGGYNNTSYALSTSSFICNSWIRTTGATGWYNESYGGGWYMTDTTYVRAYNSKAVYVENTGNHAIYTAGGFASARGTGALFSSYYNGTWYTDTLYNHGNGNLSIDAPGGNVYVAYNRGNTYFGGGTYYINRSGYFNGNVDKVDGYHASSFLIKNGWWTSSDTSKHVNNLNSGIAFAYTTHGAPKSWGTLVAFTSGGNDNYVFQMHSTGNNYLYFRNKSSDYGQKDWLQVQTTAGYGTGNPTTTVYPAGSVYYKLI